MDMPGESQYLLVDIRVLPEAFHKVVKAKQLLAQGKVKNLSEATKAVRLSRSAFYKYKDSVFTWHNTDTRQIATLTCELIDEPGVLSSLLAVLSAQGSNVLTINQNIPVDSVAPVSISMRTGGLSCTVAGLTKEIKSLYGVVSARILSN
jgi:chorismate mutase